MSRPPFFVFRCVARPSVSAARSAKILAAPCTRSSSLVPIAEDARKARRWTRPERTTQDCHRGTFAVPAGNRSNGKLPVIRSGPFTCICTLFALKNSFLPTCMFARANVVKPVHPVRSISTTTTTGAKASANLRSRQGSRAQGRSGEDPSRCGFTPQCDIWYTIIPYDAARIGTAVFPNRITARPSTFAEPRRWAGRAAAMPALPFLGVTPPPDNPTGIMSRVTNRSQWDRPRSVRPSARRQARTCGNTCGFGNSWSINR